MVQHLVHVSEASWLEEGYMVYIFLGQVVLFVNDVKSCLINAQFSKYLGLLPEQQINK